MRAVQIRGTAKKIRELVHLSKQALRDGAYRVANRLHAVALNMEGRTAPEIADVLKVHRSNVCLWLEHWREEGLEGILEGHRPGRPSPLSAPQREQLADILESGPVAYGFRSGVWTCPMVARVIEEEFSLSYHPAHVSRILHRLEFSVQRPRKLLARADQALQSKWIRYRYPNLKKKPKAKRPPSSSKTKPASAKTPPSTRPGRAAARSPKSRRPGSETPSKSSAPSSFTPFASLYRFEKVFNADTYIDYLETTLRSYFPRKAVYMTFGPYDFVQIIEAPDDAAVAKYVLSVNSKGNVRTTTMRAFDEPEHFEFLKNLP